MPNQAKKTSLENPGFQLMATEQEENYQWLAESAYYKALARGFMPDHDQEDWLEAKKDYRALLLKRRKNGLVSLQ